MQIHSAISTMPYSLPRQSTAGGPSPVPAAEARPADPELPASGALKAADTAEAADASKDSRPVPGAAASASAEHELSQEDLQQIELLKQRDAEVRAHEQAHMAAGGPYVTGGASYSYQTGPDGKSYAIGGEVGVDTSAISGDPQASLAKARTLIRAAMAPAEPSAQDHQVAAAARSMEAEAQRELSELQAMAQEAGVGEPGGAGAAKAEGQGSQRAPISEPEGNAAPRSERLRESPDRLDAASGASQWDPKARLEQRIASLFSTRPEPTLSQLA